MNFEHFKAFLWLRWRLRASQFLRGGSVDAVLFTIIMAIGVIAAVTLFIFGISVGLSAFEGAAPYVHLFTWDGIVLALLFLWMMGLMTALQRSEALSLDRFLHLPVSLSAAFLINYVSSLFNVTLILFVPGMVGLILGLTIAKGPLMVLALPLMTAAIFALTALTYQFQGWIASLMANPRRRRTIIVIITAAFILVAQAPNLMNLARPWDTVTEPYNQRQKRMEEASKALESHHLTPEEYKRRVDEIDEGYDAEQKLKNQQALDRAVRTAHIVNAVLPPGWLPLGVEGLAEGAVIPALLGTLGLTLIGSASLWRAYRTTLRIYTGHYTAKERKETTSASPPPRDPTKTRLVEWRLPWIGEHASAVAAAGFRSLIRAPEAKMAFLAPLITVVVLGGAMASGAQDRAAALRPLMAYGVGAMVMFIAGIQLMGNQFGYDRAGFRVYVLSPISRRDILLGKNLAFAPLVLGLGFLGFVIAGVVYPMRVDHYPAVLLQLLSTFLILCMMSNVLAILTPIPLAAGSLQPSSVRAGPIVMHLLAMLCLPILISPVLAPYGLEVILAELDVARGVPVSLMLSLVILAVVGFVYRWVIGRQGVWLATREQKILEVVTSRAE
ncbi:MAG TPA: hypothetical protein VLM40_16755 [Gemmata sp.]|nr:hypothetical protein [Gemmata sp.]